VADDAVNELNPAKTTMIDLKGYGHQLASGTLVTVEIFLASLALGLVIGLITALAKLSRQRIVRKTADLYCDVTRGLPELLTILLVYFGVPILLTRLLSGFGIDYYLEVSPFVGGVVALGFYFGAYAAEIFRGAILSVPKGQIEAAHAFALNPTQIYRRIILPQAWRIALPGLGNMTLALMKNTALVSAIGLDELMRKTSMATAITHQPFTFYFTASLIYLSLTFFISIAMHFLERRTARGVKEIRA
jgi:putative lysine/arginine/ornithine/histidine/octopine transport system permease protein